MSTQKNLKPTGEELQAALQTLIAQGRKDGMIRAAELNALLEKMDVNAEKIEIGRAVEALFPGVKVASVNVMNYSGKPKRMGRSPKVGRRADWKKAIVTLSEGAIEIA